ncbi:hypothetical protein ACTWPT_56900 [Nonomuraea sp. 3N208]|uniref:hypothetical protein n=1 Tax=Nonomuraea sp. 3N208 TaxID=3457421 RepID=UPI003FD4ACF1
MRLVTDVKVTGLLTLLRHLARARADIVQAVTAFAGARTHDSDEAAEQALADAYLRLDVALDLN